MTWKDFEDAVVSLRAPSPEPSDRLEQAFTHALSQCLYGRR